MKRITVIIDDDYADIVSITAIGTIQISGREVETNAMSTVREISDGDVIYLPKDMEVFK